MCQITENLETQYSLYVIFPTNENYGGRFNKNDRVGDLLNCNKSILKT